MKKLFAPIGIAIVLAACTNSTENTADSTPSPATVAPETTIPVTVAPATLPPATIPNVGRTDELLMIQAIEGSTGLTEGWDFDGQLAIDTAYLICANLRGGTSMDAIVAMLMSSASDTESLTFLTAVTAGAITFLCPDMQYLLD